jgi:uncharacterized membrane protein (UPF0127 family)
VAHFLTDALEAPGQWGLRIERTGSWLVQTLELAGDSETRKKGLLGRDQLASQTGFVIAPSQGVHTFGMRFPIDIVGVTREGRVVKVRSDVRPSRLVFALRAYAILELASGVADTAGLAVDDVLVATRRDEERVTGS